MNTLRRRVQRHTRQVLVQQLDDLRAGEVVDADEHSISKCRDRKRTA